jgi:hypothetical protein
LVLSIKCSLDNLTIVGKYKAGFLNEVIRPLLDTLPLVKNVNVSTYGMYQYNAYCEAGVFLSFGKDIESDRNIRIEFNPNKLNKRYERDLLEILKFVRYPHFSRRDIAMDFFDEWNINDYSYFDTKSRKRITYESGSRQLETLYMGAKDSDEQIRIYDKAKESGKDLIKEGTKWMRVEAQLRREKANALGYNPFESIRITRKEGAYKNLDYKERAVLELLERDPSVWDEISKNYKTKLRKLIAENTTVEIIDVKAEYEKWIEELEADAKTWLQACAKDKFQMIEEMEGWNNRG